MPSRATGSPRVRWRPQRFCDPGPAGAGRLGRREVLSQDEHGALDRGASLLFVAAADFLPVTNGDEVVDAALQVEGGAQERVPVPAHDLLQAGRLARSFAAFLELALEADLE